MTPEETFERASELARTLVTLSFEDDDVEEFEDKPLRQEILQTLSEEPEAVLVQMVRIFVLAVRSTYDDQQEYMEYMLKAALQEED